MSDPDALRALAVELATEAAVFARDGRPDDLDPRTKSTATDVVTVMDMRVEHLLRDRITEARPADGILGEEGGSVAGTSGLTWVIDPIDGTTSYLYDLPSWSVSVAVVTGDPSTDDWEPVAGAVCAPYLHAVWSAARGGGATRSRLDGAGVRALRLQEPTPLDQALVATGFAYEAALRERQALALQTVLPRIRDIRRLGSAAIDLCLVADGRLDAYYETGLRAWDLAAGRLIVTEAGGEVSGGAGRPPGSHLVIAGHRDLVSSLWGLLADAASL